MGLQIFVYHGLAGIRKVDWEREACCYVVNAFLSRSELIRPTSRLKIRGSKMFKKCVLGEKIQGLNRNNIQTVVINIEKQCTVL